MNFTRSGLFRVDHLRYKRVWVLIGLAIAFVIVCLSVIDVPDPIASVMLNDKLMHCFVYACLMGWFTQIFRHDLTRLFLVLVFVALGIGVEFAQAMTPHRQFEVLDMVANTSGVILAWALAYTWVGTILERFEKTCLNRPVSAGRPQSTNN